MYASCIDKLTNWSHNVVAEVLNHKIASTIFSAVWVTYHKRVKIGLWCHLCKIHSLVSNYQNVLTTLLNGFCIGLGWVGKPTLVYNCLLKPKTFKFQMITLELFTLRPLMYFKPLIISIWCLGCIQDYGKSNHIRLKYYYMYFLLSAYFKGEPCKSLRKVKKIWQCLKTKALKLNQFSTYLGTSIL